MVVAGGFQSCIDIHLRMRPVSGVAIAEYEVDQEEGTVEWFMPRQAVPGMTNHQREKYNFSFTGILNTDSKQDVVFDTVAKKVVLGALDGYNGTIFAYGQTGSGKTFTITGGTERYVDRGIIPRALSMIFSELAKRSEYTYQLHFSYLEIYNETGYDLLNPDHETKSLEDLPKVTMLEDEDNCIHLRNLSQHLATNEEEALNLLFVGDTNRMISATPMNLASSRSHCIFTVTVEARKAGEDTVRKSKLHLVDLAGSERVWKKGIDGQVLKEAKYINLSLHFLEQVIIALQERSQGKPRHHIPYRNSMMTSVLRDSVGGNCLTVMIATVTIAQEQLEETISTCRFAQRVALVSNEVMINEEVDPNLVIMRLKQEIKDLKEELHLLRGDQERRPLNANELNILRSQINNYVADPSMDASLNCGGTMVQIRAAFEVFKEMIKKSETKDFKPKEPFSDVVHAWIPSKLDEPQSNSFLQETISNLNHQLQQRENEINILVSFIRKREKGVVTTTTSTQAPELSVTQKECPALIENGEDYQAGDVPKDVCKEFSGSGDGDTDVSPQQLLAATLSWPDDRLKAFKIFKSSYPSWDAIEENKGILKAKYTEAKALGEQVNRAREKINEMKARVEKHRVDKAMQNLVQGVQPPEFEYDPKEDQLISIIEMEKRVYKEKFNRLRDLKKEIEHLHLLLQQSRIRLQEDFEKWLNPFAANGQQHTTTTQMDLENWMTKKLENELNQPSKQPSRPSSAARTPCPLDSSAVTNSGATSFPSNPSQWPVQGALTDSQGRPSIQQAHLLPEKSILDAETELLRGLLTGNASVDADILAFYKARADILSLSP